MPSIGLGPAVWKQGLTASPRSWKLEILRVRSNQGFPPRIDGRKLYGPRRHNFRPPPCELLLTGNASQDAVGSSRHVLGPLPRRGAARELSCVHWPQGYAKDLIGAMERTGYLCYRTVH